MDNKVKLVFSGKLARYLLKLGYQIIDIKANKYMPERSIFVFYDSPELKETIRELTSN